MCNTLINVEIDERLNHDFLVDKNTKNKTGRQRNGRMIGDLRWNIFGDELQRLVTLVEVLGEV